MISSRRILILRTEEPANIDCPVGESTHAESKAGGNLPLQRLPIGRDIPRPVEDELRVVNSPSCSRIDLASVCRSIVRAVGNYLKRWGFTPQKPLTKAYEQSPQAVGKWLDEEYSTISKRAKHEGVEIHWGDETGLPSDDVRGRGYAPKRRTPVVLANANRSRLNVISTVTNKGQMRWKVSSGALNAKILIDFMKRLVQGCERRVFLVLDNLRMHHSKAVKKWLAKNEDKIQILYLPSYSPELNPDELLNADLKQCVTKIALTRTAIGALRSIQKQLERVESYFGHQNVCYAAA